MIVEWSISHIDIKDALATGSVLSARVSELLSSVRFVRCIMGDEKDGDTKRYTTRMTDCSVPIDKWVGLSVVKAQTASCTSCVGTQTKH